MLAQSDHAAGTEAIGDFLRRRHGLFINGEWRQASAQRRFDVHDPATGGVVASVAEGDAADIDLAVAAARRSFDDRRWRGMSADARSKVMWRIADLLEANADELALLDVVDNGMPLGYASAIVGFCAMQLRYYAGLITKTAGRNSSPAISHDGQRVHAYTTVEPVGVAGIIIPWNVPLGALVIKVAPALAAGCSLVCKPAELTPLAALRFAELVAEAGLPAGVLNIVPGFGPTAGQALVDHPLVDKVSFTGSTATGKRILQSAAGNLKRVTLELGGKSPVIVFDDADPDVAIPGAAMGIFANTGQVCVAGSRLFVQKKSFDKVVAGIADFASAMKIGSGLDPQAGIGPLISQGQRDKVLDYIESGRKDGAQVVTGGDVVEGDGYFVKPTVFANVNRDMRIVREEIFGPVLVATPIDDLDELVRAANDSRYGLGAGIYTNDVNKAHLVAERLQAGTVWVNGYGFMDPSMPFGGFKESGWGRELGTEGMAAFQEIKSVFIQLKA